MKLKTDNGVAVLQDGKPVYVADDGTETVLDPPALFNSVRRLTAENTEHRKARKEAEERARVFEGLDDPEAARAALETVKGLSDKTKADLEKARAEVAKVMQPQIDAAKKEAAEIQAKLHGELIGGGFARSKFIAEKLAIPADVAQAFFGSAFAVENGVLVAKGKDGQPILSRTTGQPASFDEALEVLVGGYERKDSILKADQKGGSGASPGASGGKATKQMPESEFNALGPKDQAARMAEGYVLT